jgi:polar amino acid transport system substrate-binding protein
MAGFNRRFAPISRQIKERFKSRSGPMTLVYRVNAGQLPREHWSHDELEGGGRVIGEVCHFVDFVQFMSDALPIRVSAIAVPQESPAGFMDDSLTISLGMSDGSVASIIYTASGDSSVAKERVEVFCDRSVATIEDFREGSFYKDSKRTKLGGGAQDKGHAAEIAAFLAAARGESEAPISLESLAATSLATFAIVESARSGQSVLITVGEFL